MHLQTMKTNRASRGATNSVLAVVLATTVLLGLTGLPALEVHATSSNALQSFVSSSSAGNMTSTPTDNTTVVPVVVLQPPVNVTSTSTGNETSTSPGNATNTPTDNATVVPVYILQPTGNITSTSTDNVTGTSTDNVTRTSTDNATIVPVYVLKPSGSTTASSHAILGGNPATIAMGVTAVILVALGAAVVILRTRSHQQ